MSFLSILSTVVGWSYFFCWSISFYGNIYEIHKVKHVRGIAFDFLALNLTGFLFLSTYSTMKYFYTDNSSVKIEDLAFAYHATLATLVTIGQCIYFYKTRGDNKVRPWCLVFLVLLWGTAISYGIYTYYNGQPINQAWDLYSVMGYEKLTISFIKYLPQVYLNYNRKSTEGWSIFNILLDFMGGFLSFFQIVIDSIEADTDTFSGDLNIVKFVLSIIAMGFDLIFMFQHYILYNPNKKKRELLMAGYTDNDKKPTHIAPIDSIIPINERK